MLEFEEQKLKLEGLLPDLEDLKDALKLDAVKQEVERLEGLAAADGFWDDIENSQQILQKTSQLKAKIEKYNSLRALFDDTVVLIELADEAEDLSLLEEVLEGVASFESKLEEQRLETLLTGEYDSKNAILTFHAGAGGTEAQDWNEMLVRMYTHWGERHGFSVKMLDFLDGDDAGLKSAVLLIEGQNAYGYLKSENGVHRLVRISPFDSSGRRHTSFASLEVMPEIDGDTNI